MKKFLYYKTGEIELVEMTDEEKPKVKKYICYFRNKEELQKALNGIR